MFNLKLHLNIHFHILIFKINPELFITIKAILFSLSFIPQYEEQNLNHILQYNLMHMLE